MFVLSDPGLIDALVAARKRGVNVRVMLNEQDEDVLKWVRAFNPYDLYSKCEVEPNLAELRPFYEELVAEFFPAKINW